jgi:hypothetical protein
VGALEGFFTFNGVGQALSGLWDTVTSLPDYASSYLDAVGAANRDTNEIFRYLSGEVDSVDFNSPIAGRIQDDGSVLPILGDTIRGAVMASPLGLIDAGYRGDWYSFGQRLPSLLEAPLLARGLGKAALDAPTPLFGTVRETGDAVTDLLYGARPKSGLPGSAGVEIPRRPTPLELENLTVKHDVEFAVTYKLGNGKGGSGGQYFLHSGIRNSVDIPLEADRMFIYHTHPEGTALASPADRSIMETLELLGSPQRSSQIIPVGKDTVRFNKDTTINWWNK